MSVIATSTPTVSPALIIGAACVLLGSVFTMAAPTPYYREKERWKKTFERAGRIVSFAGALAALVGTTIEGKQPAHGVVTVASLLVVELVMIGVLAPVAWRSLKETFGKGENDEQETGGT